MGPDEVPEGLGLLLKLPALEVELHGDAKNATPIGCNKQGKCRPSNPVGMPEPFDKGRPGLAPRLNPWAIDLSKALRHAAVLHGIDDHDGAQPPRVALAEQASDPVVARVEREARENDPVDALQLLMRSGPHCTDDRM